MHREFGVV